MLALLAVIGGSGATAQEARWTGPAGGDWFNGANWQGGSVPSAPDTVIVEGAGPEIDGGTIEIGQLLIDGDDTGAGSVDAKGGVQLKTSGVILGGEAGYHGNLTIRGAGTHWSNDIETVSDWIYVGHADGGIGSLVLADGAVADTEANIYIGSLAGSTGTAILSGSNTRWNAGYVDIGGTAADAKGTLRIEGGAVFNPYTTAIYAGSRATVTGAGSTWLGPEDPGLDGGGLHVLGELVVENGGHVDVYGMTFAGAGDARVSGSDTKLDLHLLHFFEGGTLTLSDGAKADVESDILLDIGYNDENGGVLILEGAGTTLTGGNFRAGDSSNNAQSRVTVRDGGQLSTAGTSRISGSAQATITGAGSLWEASTFSIDKQASLTLSDGGTVRATTVNANSGNIHIGGKDQAAAPGTIDAASVKLQGALNFNHDSIDYTFAPVLQNNGTINVLSGRTTLSADSSAFTGATTIHGGRFNVTGALGGAIAVRSGGTLEGSGGLGAVTVDDGGILAPGDRVGTLTMSSLVLSDASIMNFDMGPAGIASASDRIVVTGDLTLDGIVNITDMGGFGNGVYTLIEYGNLVADNGLELDVAPAGTYSFDSGSGSNSAVTMEVTGVTAAANQYWDGPNNTQGDVLYGRGGVGVWNASNTNWTNVGGSANTTWDDQFAIFYNNTGEVTVEGEQSAAGMQFAADGYRLVAGAGGVLNLTGVASELRVDPGNMATLALPLTVAGDLLKEGGGTLNVAGEADISGSLTASAGVLRVADGGSVEAELGYVMYGASLVVDGVGSTLITREAGVRSLNIGYASDGDLTITAGGKVESGFSYVGIQGYTEDGAVLPYKGTADISGAGSFWDAASLTIGSQGGDGELRISDGAVVNSETGSIGNGYLQPPANMGIPARGSTGRVIIENAGSEWVLDDELTVGAGGGSGTLTVAAGGELRSKNLYLGHSADTFGDLLITGAGSAVNVNAGIFVGYGGRGDLTIADGAQASSDRVWIGTQTNGIGHAVVTGEGSLWTVGDLIEIGTNGGTGTLTLSDGGVVRTGAAVQNGFAGIALGGNAANGGTLNIGAAPGEVAVAAGTVEAAYVSFNGTNGTLNFNHSGVTTFAPVIDSLSGLNHSINHHAGTTILTGDPASYTSFNGFRGTTTIYGGTLLVGDAAGNGALGGQVIVKSGATLGGSGQIGLPPLMDGDTRLYNIVEAGGILAPGTNGVGTLTLSGAWRFDTGSQLHFQIGAPGTTDSPGTSDRIIMTQDAHLDLSGRPELHISDIGGAGIGHYRLITTTGGTMTYGTQPGYFDIVAPDTVANASYAVVETLPGSPIVHYDLVISSASVDPEIGDPNLQYWQDSSPGWNAPGTDWRNSGGTADVAWAGNHGVFNGAGSAIAVEGTQSFKGLQFVTSGYTLGGSGMLQTVASGSELRVLGDETATIAAVIAGSGGITKTQGGTLILSGNNSYTGKTIVEAGTLILQGNGSIGASSGLHVGGSGTFDISDASSGMAQVGSLSGSGIVSLGASDLVVTQNEATTFDGYMTGTGGFTLSGPQTLTVTGIVASGLTTVSTGSTLKVGGGAPGTGGQVTNDIHNAGTLIIDRGDTGHWEGVLSGSGHLINRGPGTTIFAGDSSLYTGTVNLEGGTFRLTDSGVLGASQLNIGNGATLGGTGRVAGNILVASGGVFAPGNSIGTFHVTGDVSFAAGSIFDVEIAANGDADRIAATGAVTLQGGMVQVTALDPYVSYVNGQHYTIISADGGVAGTFDEVLMLNHSAFIAPTLEHDSHAVVLSIAVVREFETAAQTLNQREAARGLFGFDQAAGSDALVAFNSIAGLNGQDVRAAFDLASGEIHASSQYAIADAADLFTRTVQRRAGTMPKSEGQIMPWLAILGQSARHDADGNAARLSSRAYGLAGGLDLVNGNLGDSGAVQLGLATGYLDGRTSVDGRRSEADYDSTLVGAYLSLSLGPLHLSGALSLGWHDLDTERWMAWGGALGGALDRTATASRDARTVGYSAALRYDLPIGELRLSPIATLDIADVKFKAARERGADALNLDLARENFTTASVGAGAEIGFGTQAFSGSIRVLYDHRIGDALPLQRAAFVGSSQSHTVFGPKMRNSGISAGGAFAYRLSSRAAITASYDGIFSSDANDHRGGIAVSIGF